MAPSIGTCPSQNICLVDIQVVTRRRGYLRNEEHSGTVTTRQHLQREWEIVNVVKEGVNQFQPLAFDYHNSNPQLDAEQRKAVEGLMGSCHFVTLFRGGAGTGKSFTLREVWSELQRAGRLVRAIAPQRQQVMDLQKEGFDGAETVSAFITKSKMARHAVILVDEAGQLGGKQMHALLDLVQANEGRVILSGDTRQHGAVEATDALRAIEKYSGVQPVELTNIRRQNPELARTLEERRRIEEYKLAVTEARDGKFSESFNRLNEMGAIEQCTPGDQHDKLTRYYLERVKAGQSTAVVSQSWNEIHQVNERIRLALKAEKLIGDMDATVTALHPVDLTDAQKRDSRWYGCKSLGGLQPSGQGI